MWEERRILIWGKTYPELSAAHRETVCTGGCFTDGSPVRIYPVPFRLIEQQRRYQLYSWIRAPVAPSTSDTRPESYKINPDRIEVLEHLDTAHGWEARREVIFKNTSWCYKCLGDLKEAQQHERTSLGVIPVREVTEVRLMRRSESNKLLHEQKLREIKSRLDLFDTDPAPDLKFFPYRVRVRWRCKSPLCPGHSSHIYDWGLGELGRRNGERTMLAKMEEISNVDAYDLHFFAGNLKTRPHIFIVVGVWYPKRKHMQQPSLFTPWRP